MQEKEIIWKSKGQADILSQDFYEQLGLENAELPSTEQPFYCALDIEVPHLYSEHAAGDEADSEMAWSQ